MVRVVGANIGVSVGSILGFLEALEALGGHFSKLMTTKMTVLISALVGVSGHKKSRFAKEQGLPIISLPRFAEALAAAGAAAWGAAAMPSF